MSEATEKLAAILTAAPTLKNPAEVAAYLDAAVAAFKPVAALAEVHESTEATLTQESLPEAPPAAPEPEPVLASLDRLRQLARAPEAPVGVDIKHVHTLLIDAKERLAVNALGDVATFIDRAIKLLEV